MRLTVLIHSRRALVEDPEPTLLPPTALRLLLALATRPNHPLPAPDLLHLLPGWTLDDLRPAVRLLAHCLPGAVRTDANGYALAVHPDDLLLLP